MRVLILVISFPPEITGSGHLYHQLADSLCQMGHQVKVVTPLPRQRMGAQAEEIRARYGRRLFAQEKMGEIEVYRPAVLPLPLSNPLTKGLDHFSVPFSNWVASQFAGQADVVLLYSPPLPLALAADLLSRQRRIPFVLNLQDIFPQYAIDAGIMTNKTMIGFFRRLESYVYRRARYIAVHSPGNLEYLASHGVPREKITVIHNWVDAELIRPGERMNGFRDDHNLGDDFVISYAGTMGWAQDLDTVIEAAAQLRRERKIRFLMVGDGPRRNDLEEKARAQELDNVTFLPLQPRDRYLALLQSSDICLLSLNPSLSTPVVPGKLMDIMAAARPVVASVPLDGDVPRIIGDARCGLCVESGDGKRLADSILTLCREPQTREEMGRKGRKYAEEHLSRTACTAQYARLLQRAVALTGDGGS